jgi:hypothetical protein
MSASISRQENERRWREHIQNYNSYNGSMVAYCLDHKISPKSFYRWRAVFAGKETVTSCKSKKPQAKFVPVQVVKETQQSIRGLSIDPSWVAEFVLQLHLRSKTS